MKILNPQSSILNPQFSVFWGTLGAICSTYVCVAHPLGVQCTHCVTVQNEMCTGKQVDNFTAVYLCTVQ